uniref:Transcription and mRNA export factor ENY2 n=1 Tax=Chromera velia CCMP2878 TaxID=1169474 RepID=A0A0K6S7I5_9ALVE|eukprot:Cvel_569.t2-p1 / transcript=Cvel_569.t2 / gene=Cvel_569 / organism=Chromera_velia_CCMP2878 / gene_product=Enhancer of yellow 2 transcription factor homolog, putative / transcript_product=Enhancer of yellow 2 transcription factor homolog, putative / location=Cvel_scaffold17:182683-183195(-) / protein_length=87 / sequence_SO=supercontig / SO=protein_coding / is_pseudo=false
MEFIKSRGFDRLSTDEVIAALRPKGRQTVPEDVKAELLSRIRMFAEVQLGRVQQQGGGGAQTGNGGAAGEGVGAADGAQLKLSRSTT